MLSHIVVMNYPPWLIYPGSAARLTLIPDNPTPTIEMAANPQGLASFSNILLWLTAYSDPCGLSVSGLPFVTPVGRLALSIALEMELGDLQGRLRLLDKDQQYEWQADDDALRALAVSLHQLASHPEDAHYIDADLSPDSGAYLRFDVTAGA